MCGIVGYISNNDNLYTASKDHFMRYALALDTLRGEDSTGIITLNKRFTVKTLKTTMPGDSFVHSKDYKKKYKTGWAQIGHNRAATKGSVSIENAHPFTFGPITMVHNGTLSDGGASLDTFDKKIGDVDSMQIAYALSKYPPEEAKDVLANIYGAFALVWSDQRDESVNMARNSERPLHITFNQNKSIMWYMSDGHHLHSINKSLGNHESKGEAIYEMDRQKILKFHKGNNTPEVIKFDPFVRPATSYKTYGNKTTKTNTKTGGSDSKYLTPAAKRAAEKWEKNIESNSTPLLTDGKESPVQVEVQGKMRRVPKCMQDALRSELYLSPNDLLRFKPDRAVQLPNGNYTVYGSFIHSVWADILWDMTIYNVKKVQYRAYQKDDWLVRPIGICAPHSFCKSNSAAIGYLVHCDWKGYTERCSKVAKAKVYDKEANSSDDEKEGDSMGDALIQGPDGHMMSWSKLQVMLEGGCINCGMDLMNEDLTNCMEVNNGQDIICDGCVKEMIDERAITPTIN